MISKRISTFVRCGAFLILAALLLSGGQSAKPATAQGKGAEPAAEAAPAEALWQIPGAEATPEPPPPQAAPERRFPPTPAQFLGEILTAEGAPAANLRLRATLPDRSFVLESVADAQGLFGFFAPEPGTYRLQVMAAGGQPLVLLDNQALVLPPEAGTPERKVFRLLPTPGPESAGATEPPVSSQTVNLQAAGAITGSVRAAGTNLPLVSAYVAAYQYGSYGQAYAFTNSEGQYALTGLSAGTYQVYFGSTGDYAAEWYDSQPAQSSALAINVPDGGAVGNINATLELGGRISGLVTDTATGNPIPNERVSVYDANYDYQLSATTNASGVYTTTGLAQGSYRLYFQSQICENQSCRRGDYINEWYNDKTSSQAADPVAVTVGATTSGIDAALAIGGKITGRVTDAATGSLISTVYVQAYDVNYNYQAGATVDASGVYTISGLATGSYRLNFISEICENQSCRPGDYINEWYNDKPSFDAADPVAVTAGATTGGIDAALAIGGKITGQVTDAATGSPMPNVYVEGYDVNYNYQAGANVDASGVYTISGLPPGSYRARFVSQICDSQSCRSGDYVSEWYNDKPSFDAADPVVVTGGATTSGIDAALALGGKITGRVTDAATGNPIPNVYVGVYDVNYNFQAGANVDASGAYTVTGVASGAWRLRFHVNYSCDGQVCYPSDYASEWYNDKPSFYTADPVAVTAGATTSGIDAALAIGGKITGQVTDALTGNPIPNGYAAAYDANGNYLTGANTDASGVYTITGVPAGDCRLYFQGSYVCDAQSCQSDYLVEWYNDKPSLEVADPITVTAGATTSGIDAALAIGGKITGRVTDAGTGLPVSGVQACAHPPGNGWYVCAATNASGVYTLTALASDTYRVDFIPPSGSGFLNTWYNNKASFDLADPISVTAGSVYAGINASLQRTVSPVVLGQPGTSFRHVATFGITETPYIADTAHLNFPWGLTTDGTDVIIGELLGQRVLKYTGAGALVSVLGRAGISYQDGDLGAISDMAVDASGNTWMTDQWGQVHRFDASGAFLGRFREGEFRQPAGIAFDAGGNVYISDGGQFWSDDYGHQNVRVYDSGGNFVSAIGVTDTVGADNNHFWGPQHIAIYGNTLYVADGGNNRVQLFDISTPATPVYSATIGIAGEGGSDNAHLSHPTGVAVDANYVYVADRWNHRVQVFSRTTLAYVTTIGSGYGTGNGEFNNPTDVAVDADGNVYVADFANCRIQKFSSSWVYERTFGVTGVPYLTDGSHYNSPGGVAVAADGSIYLTEENGHRLFKLDAAGTPQWSVGIAGLKGDWVETTNGNLNNPSDVALDAAGRVVVADQWHSRVQIFNPNGSYFATLGGGTGDYGFVDVAGLTVAPNGYIYVADGWRHRVQIFNANRTYVATLGETDVFGSDNAHFNEPTDVVVDGNGMIYVADSKNHRVQVFNSSRAYVRTLGVSGIRGSDFGHLSYPTHLATDSANRLYVSDSDNSRVQVFDSTGAYLTTLGGDWNWGSGPGQFRGPQGLATDQAGTLYVGDSGNHRLQKFALGVPGWSQRNINGFGQPHVYMESLEPFDGQLYAGVGNWDNAGGQVWRSADGLNWSAASEPGFGTAYSQTNRAVLDLVTFKGQLYASAGWGDNNGQIWRSPDGTTWEQVMDGGLGSADTTPTVMAVYSDTLYAGTGSGSLGFQIWRTDTGNALSWTNVVTGGHGSVDNRYVTGLTVFNGSLYAAVEGLADPATGLQIWRTENGADWAQANTDGFGGTDNYLAGGLAAFDGYLYAGTGNYATGGQVWRTDDGTTWESVVGNGFGDLNNHVVQSLYAYGGYLYVSTDNPVTGAEVWRSSDGAAWQQISPDGFGSASNTGMLWSSAVAAFDNRLYFATLNNSGGQIWQLAETMGTPVLAVMPAVLNFGTLSVRMSATLPITLSNTGTADLDVTGVSSDHPDFSVNFTPLVLTPGASRVLPVTFAPASGGPLTGTLTITSTGGISTVLAIGNGLPSPAIQVAPAALAQTLAAGDVATRTLTISNTGSSSLAWAVRSGQVLLVNDGAYNTDSVHAFQMALDNLGMAYDVVSSDYNTGIPAPLMDYQAIIYAGIPDSGAEQGQLIDYLNAGGRLLIATSDLGYAYGGSAFHTTYLQATHQSDDGSAGVITGLDFMSGITTDVSSDPWPDDFTINGPDAVGIFRAPSGNLAGLAVARAGYRAIYLGWDYQYAGGEAVGDIVETAILGRALDWLGGHSWLATWPESGNLAAGGSQPISVTLDATGLVSGTYAANLHVRSNDPIIPVVTVPVTMRVIGTPVLALTPTLLDFGTVYVGMTATLPMTLSNVGTAELALTGMSSDDPDVGVSFTPAVLAPGASRVVSATFAPRSGGPLAATLTITSTAGVTTVAATGIGRLPPSIQVTPATLAQTLAAGNLATRTLTITNAGSGDLNFVVNIAPSDAVLLLNFDESAGATTFQDASGHGNHATCSGATCPTAGVAGKLGAAARFDGINDYVAVPHSASFDALEAKDKVTVAAWVNIAAWYGGWFSIVDKIEPSIDFGWTFQIHSGGGLGFIATPGMGSADCNYVPNLNEWVHLAVTYDQSANSAVFYANGEPQCERSLSAEIIDATGPLYIGYNPSGGDEYSNGRVDELAIYDRALSAPEIQALYALNSGSVGSWLSVSPISGTVTAGSSTQITVNLDATNLIGDVYVTGISIASNDPFTPVVTVPMTLTVIGTPVLAVTPTVLNFGTLYVGMTATLPMTLSNVGTAELALTGMSSDDADITMGFTPTVLAPGASRVLPVTFAPTTAGPLAATLTITSTGGNATVLAAGQSLWPPALQVTPAVLAETLAAGNLATRTLTITNGGSGDLTFSMDVFNRSGVAVGGNVAVLGAENTTAYANDVVSKLQATGQFNSVTFINVAARTPSLAELQTYQAVLVFSNSSFYNATTFGNALADYVDAGGGVVVMHFALYSSYQLGGRFASGGYYALQPSGSQSGSLLTLGAINVPGHPVLQGVSSFSGGSSSYHSTGAAAAGATVVAQYSNGRPLVVEKSLPGQWRRVDLNFFPPSSNARSDFWNASTDGARLMANALSYVGAPPFVTGLPVTGTLPASNSVTVPVGLTTTKLISGTYLAAIRLASNDPFTPVVTVPVTLTVVGTPVLAVTPTVLNFGTVYVGVSATLTMTLSNAGTADLGLTGLSSDAPDVTVSFTPTVLAPQASRVVSATFAPASAGPLAATLTITSTGGVSTLPATGSGLLPPSIQVAPGHFQETLAAGTVVTRSLTITNGGHSDLNFFIPCQGGDLEYVLAVLNRNYQAVVDAIPNRFLFSEGITGSSIFDGDLDMYDGGNYLRTSLGGNLSYSDNSIISSALLGPGGRYFTRKYPGLFVFVADLRGVDYFEITGNLGADGMGNVDSAILSSSNHIGFVKRVFNAWDPSVNHLVIVSRSENPSATHSYSTNTNDDQHRVSSLGSRTRLYYLLYAASNGGYIDNAATQTIFTKFLEASQACAGWLTATPVTATVAAGQSMPVEVMLDAANLVSGTYAADLRVISNDPFTPVVAVPVTLTVTGIPGITAAPATLDMGTAFVGYPTTRSITITNPGTADLDVTSITTDSPELAVASSSLSVPARSRRTVQVTYTPGSPGTLAANLIIHSNAPQDGVISMPVTGSAIRPPGINASPASFSLSVNTDQVLTRTLQIQNTGLSALTFSLSTLNNRVTLNPLAGAVAAGGEQLITVTFDGTRFAQGNYTDRIDLSSNDPANPYLQIPVAMSVVLVLPEAPSSPNPLDGESNVRINKILTWQASPHATAYDLTLWRADQARPVSPTAVGLTYPSYDPPGDLPTDVQYYWDVLARNSVGARQGPQWTFTTETLPDLAVATVTVPSIAYSGQSFQVSWVVTNQGDRGTTVSGWYDRAYLSPSSTFDQSSATYLGQLTNPAYLGPGESYASQATFTLPKNAVGNYYVFVLADIYGAMRESDEANNTGRSATTAEVRLTPPPDLQVASLTGPANAFSGASIPVQWTVANNGAGGTISTAWLDQVYLSLDATLHPTDTVLSTLYHTGALAAGERYTATTNVNLPQAIWGAYYLFVTTDVYNYVYEHTAENNNTSAPSGPLAITLSPPPDLEVSALVVPSAAESGDPISVTWQVVNNGAGAPFEGHWQDRVYLSASDVLTPSTATVLRTATHWGALQPGESYIVTQSLPLPNGITGTFYVHVWTDYANDVFEYLADGNNVSAAQPIWVSLSPSPDLRVTQVSTPVTQPVAAGTAIQASWTVQNTGDDAPATTWHDNVYISQQPNWSGQGIWLGSFERQWALTAGLSYTRTYPVILPGSVNPGTYYVYVVTDANNTIYEHNGEANNVGRSAAAMVVTAPPAAAPTDLVLGNLHGPALGASGAPITVTWTVTNNAALTTTASSWTDAVYLSADQSLNTSADLRLGTAVHSGALRGGHGYTGTLTAKLPNGIEGDYYLFFRADLYDQVNDDNRANNTAYLTQPLSVTLSPSPDLQIALLNAPASGTAGQPVDLGWAVTNTGTAAASSLWFDGVYLSSDAAVDARDTQLASLARSGRLEIGQSYTRTATVMLPGSAGGTYYLLVKTDSRNDVYEHNAEGNNLAAASLNITVPPPADLVVVTVTVPVGATPGQPIAIDWSLRNQGVSAASGYMCDAVYLSADTTWDINDVHLGDNCRHISLAPGQTGASMMQAVMPDLSVLAALSANLTGNLPGVTPGAYYAIVRADIRNQIRETDDGNNAGASTNTLRAEVPALTLSVPAEGSLGTGEGRFYRVDVAEGKTLLATLDSASAGAYNELYVRYGQIPSRGSFDFSYGVPYAPDQEIVVPSTISGTYYILAYGTNVPGGPQPFSLTASYLTFGLRSIEPAQGGQGGNVTVRLNGALMDANVTATLTNGATVVEASHVYWLDAVRAYATFDLTSAPLGVYNVKIADNGLTSTLPDAFTVVAGIPGEVRVQTGGPSTLRPGQTGALTIDYFNPGNTDADAPILHVRSDSANLRLPNKTDYADTTVQFLALSSNGPAGTLPPGSSGQMTVFFQPTISSGSLNFSVTLGAKDPIVVTTTSPPEGEPLAALDSSSTTANSLILETSAAASSSAGLLMSEAAPADLSQALSSLASQTTGISGFPCYKTVEETYNAMQALASYYPNLAEWKPIGASWEFVHSDGTKGYPINVLVLTNKLRPGPKSTLFVMGAIHARELATAELATRFAEYLVNNYDSDPRVTWLLDYNEIHILPQANPDGRKIAETPVGILRQYWRKNTNNSNAVFCNVTPLTSGAPHDGVDLNRNSSFHWNTPGTGVSSAPCDGTYRGPSAASEPEVQALEQYLAHIFPDQRGSADTDPAPPNATGLFISLHSYSGKVLFPYGYGPSAPNKAQLETLGQRFGFFNQYVVCQSNVTSEPCGMYATSGGTDDWVYGELGVAAYTFEVGKEFFQSCDLFNDQIVPGNLPALLYAAEAARRPYQTPAGPESLAVRVSPNPITPGDKITVTAKANGHRYASNGYGNEPAHSIAGARYTVDAPSWAPYAVSHPMTVVDGAYDSSLEIVEAVIDTTGWAPGRHIIFVESQDTAGNWGVPGTVFVYDRPAPVLTAESPTAYSVLLNWSYTGKDAAGFRIFRYDQEIASVGPEENSYQDIGSDQGLDCNTEYVYRVFAYDKAGESRSSNPVSVTTYKCVDPTDTTLDWRSIRIVRPVDPNDIVGPEGYGEAHWVARDSALGYTIHFENDPELATAPAQRVVITQTLDSDLDPRSFRLGAFGFGAYIFDVPANRSFYQARLGPFTITTTLPTTETFTVYVDVNAGIDVVTGQAFWSLQTIDPATGAPPTNAVAGFLPPDVGAGEGQGFVSYSVRPKAATHTGDQVDALARIVFDNNDPIDTPAVFNTLDAGRPASQLDPLPAETAGDEAVLTWSGSDDAGGSGFGAVDVYAATDDGPFVLAQANITGTTTLFRGESGHDYSFFVLARDNAGNREAPKTAAEATTRLFVSGAPASVVVTATPASLFADGFSASLITVAVQDGRGAALPGERVALATSLGSLSTISGTTGVDGVVTATLTAGTVAGRANVTASATNIYGTGTGVGSVEVRDVSVAGLTASSDSPTLLGSATHLTATISAGTNVSYLWDYGDGLTGTGLTPAHTYLATGLYTATVTAGNTAGTETALVTVTVASAIVPIEPTSPVTADFTIAPAVTMTVQIPAGAVTGQIVLVYTVLPDGTHPAPPDLKFTGVNFDLSAFQHNRQQLGLRFNQPLTLTLAYDPSILGVSEDTLELRYWNGSAWVKEDIPVISRDKGRHRLIITLPHLTQFALFGKAENKVYLPFVKR